MYMFTKNYWEIKRQNVLSVTYGISHIYIFRPQKVPLTSNHGNKQDAYCHFGFTSRVSLTTETKITQRMHQVGQICCIKGEDGKTDNI